MMDRNCAEQLPKMQCGFIDFVCSFVYKVTVFPQLCRENMIKEENLQQSTKKKFLSDLLSLLESQKIVQIFSGTVKSYIFWEIILLLNEHFGLSAFHWHNNKGKHF